MCEEFAKRNLGVDTLTKTLNDYLGLIQDAVLRAGGDVIEFAGRFTLEALRCVRRRSGASRGAIRLLF